MITLPPRKLSAKRQPHDVEAIVRLDRVSAPKQARSLDSLKRIVRAMEVLLESKSYSEISLSDIEAESKCGLATIYARFRDKASILAALHESLRDRLQSQIEDRLDPGKWAGRTFEEALTEIIFGIVTFYSRNNNLLRAVLLLDDAEVYQRAAASLRLASKRMQAFAIAKSDSRLDRRTLVARADFATRAMYALLQQRLVFQGIQTGEFTRSDREFSNELTMLFRRCFEDG